MWALGALTDGCRRARSPLPIGERGAAGGAPVGTPATPDSPMPRAPFPRRLSLGRRTADNQGLYRHFCQSPTTQSVEVLLSSTSDAASPISRGEAAPVVLTCQAGLRGSEATCIGCVGTRTVRGRRTTHVHKNAVVRSGQGRCRTRGVARSDGDGGRVIDRDAADLRIAPREGGATGRVGVGARVAGHGERSPHERVQGRGVRLSRSSVGSLSLAQEDGHRDGGKNADNGNNDQQFDKREALIVCLLESG